MYFITSLDIILTRETFLTTALCLDSFRRIIQFIFRHFNRFFLVFAIYPKEKYIYCVWENTKRFFVQNNMQNHNIFTTKQGKKQTNRTLQQSQKSWFQSLINDK